MKEKLIPSTNLLAQVRAGLITQGSCLNKWCLENDVLYSSARQALIGTWNGPKGQALREKLINEAGIAAISKVA